MEIIIIYIFFLSFEVFFFIPVIVFYLILSYHIILTSY
jgi:hypothetical protein